MKWTIGVLVFVAIFIATDASSLAQALIFRSDFAEIMELDPNQERVRQELISQFYDRDDSIDRTIGVVAFRKQLSDRFVPFLNPAQRVLYDQLVDFASAGDKMSVNLVLNAPFRSQLELTDQQSQKLRQIVDELRNEADELDKTLVARKSEIDASLAEEFERTLVPTQLRFISQHFGKNLPGLKSIVSKLPFRPSAGIQAGSSIFSMKDVSPFLFMALSAESVEPPIRYVSLVAALNEKQVVDELKLSEAQISAIGEHAKLIESVMQSLANTELSIVEGRLQIFKDVESENQKILNDPVLEQEKIEQIKRILTVEQFKRLEQVYRQISIVLGAPDGIREFNPGWVKFLDMSDEQKASFSQIQQNYLKQQEQAQQEYFAQKNELNRKGFADSLSVLTEQQKALLRSRYGAFVNTAFD